MLFNMQKLKQFSGGWIKSLYEAHDQYSDLMILADQDMINAFFFKVS